MRVAGVIPALNEAASIGEVLRQIPKDRVERVVVADNGSTDVTAQVAARGGAIVVSEPRRGYGQACLAALDYLRQNEPPDVVLFLDADLSDFPEEAHLLLDKITEGYDLVIGSRVRLARKDALLPQARFGNWLSTRLVRLFYGERFTDLGPFRAIRWEALERIAMADTNFGWTVEMQVKAARRGLVSVEIPVRYRRRFAGQSKVSGTLVGGAKAGAKILWTIGREGLR